MVIVVVIAALIESASYLMPVAVVISLTGESILQITRGERCSNNPFRVRSIALVSESPQQHPTKPKE